MESFAPRAAKQDWIVVSTPLRNLISETLVLKCPGPPDGGNLGDKAPCQSLPPKRRGPGLKQPFLFFCSQLPHPSLLPIKTSHSVYPVGEPVSFLDGVLPDSWVARQSHLDLQIYSVGFFFTHLTPSVSPTCLLPQSSPPVEA